MRAYKYILPLLVLFAAPGCVKTPEPLGTDMHEFTEEELKKKSLDDAFTLFFEAFKLDSIEDPRQEIINNSRISLPRLGTVRYTYTKDGHTLIIMDVTLSGFTADLYGNIHLEGKSLTSGGTAVFIDGEQVATLDLVWYEYREDGKTKRTPTPVFRFPDGTTYAITGVLLVEPLLEFLLGNVFSTE